ncbi:hypothetical protein FHS91_002503 [Sphingobium xanthum]|uniref:lasso peptide biosynthesis B2 protein n=1 Tax=Sphingobium xanthum TaxID=1387165 RepID=UPI001C8C7099|nr:lasso peptide biosynthesis B2 protein [Sphingobium xanthum]
MGYALRPGISFCVVDGRTIFLDLKADRYSGLPPTMEEAFAKLVGGESLTGADRNALDRLVASRLLSDGDADHRFQLRLPGLQAVSDIELLEAPSSCFRHVPAALAHLIASALRLKRGSLWKLVRQLELQKAKEATRARGSISEVLAAFRWAGLIMTSHDQCLRRSIALMRHLLCLGHRPEMVIGVAVRPFRAHCWVQHQGAVLNDRLENIRPFTPILVI